MPISSWSHITLPGGWPGESVNVFHGRGASPIISQLEHPARFALLTVIEAWIGLVIEIVLVATAVQRFFGK